MARMRFQTWVVDFLDSRMFLQMAGQSKSVLSLLSHSQIKRFQLDKEGSLFKTRFNVLFTGKGLPQPETIVSDSAGVAETDTLKVTGAGDVKTDVTKMLNQTEDYVPDDTKALEYKETFGNGQLKVVFELKDGFRHGDYKEYYDNGSIKIKGQYRRDHKDGLWKIYSENGKLFQKVKYNDGKMKE